jgi:site-specific DNA recombinase
VDRHEMEKKARRQRDMHDQRAALGTPWCPRRPFGFVPIYHKDTGKITTLAHEESEAHLVRAAYAEVLSGVGTSTIVKEWNAAEVPTTAGGKWTEPTLRRLLLNPRNAGHRTHDGVITKEDAWTPIVTAEIFDGVNAIITMKSRGKQRARRYLLSGIATCSLCGAGMESSVIKKNAAATAVRTYKCSGCTRVSRKAQLLDDYVVEALLKRLARPDAEALLIDTAKDANADKRAALKAVNAEMEELEQDRRDPDLQMTRTEYKTSRMALLARRDAIEVSIQEVTAAPLLLPLVRSANLKQDWDAYGIDRQRLVMKLLVTCVVKPVGRGVRWNSDAVEVAIR